MAIKASEMQRILISMPKHEEITGQYFRAALPGSRFHLSSNSVIPTQRQPERYYEFRKADDGSDWILVGWPEDE